MNDEPMPHSTERPRLALTMGDAAGVGPELIARVWSDPAFHAICRPLVLGDVERLRGELARIGSPVKVRPIREVGEIADLTEEMCCLAVETVPVASLALGKVHAAAGRAAYDYLVRAVDLALEGAIDGIVTLPLNKEGLHAAGLHYPGHTEILAERTGTRQFGMMLYRRGLGVLHVTLHCALRDVFAQLSEEAILEKILLLDEMLRRLGCPAPRLAVAALNPHASDGGIFGDEEERIIRPAVERARRQGLDCTGPLPTDTLFSRAKEGAYDGVVAMYHDQGHIALKVLGWREAVNITVGLPIVRTSVAHGTAYDIVGRNLADPASLYEATQVAAQLARTRSGHDFLSRLHAAT